LFRILHDCSLSCYCFHSKWG